MELNIYKCEHCNRHHSAFYVCKLKDKKIISAPNSIKNKSNTTPLEYEEAVILTDYLEMLKSKNKIIFFTKTAQETWVNNNFGVIAKNKKSGVRKGLPDFIVLLSQKLLFIELKRVKGGIISPEQELFIREANKVSGCDCVVARGSQEAIDFVNKYIN